jgi:hypothetical protein
MDKDQVNNLAEKIARLIASEPTNPDLTLLNMSIERLNARLDKIEATFTPAAVVKAQHLSHPSQDRFAVAEAIVDSLFNHDAKEKTCTFEPDRSCDHCSMCSSRGF